MDLQGSIYLEDYENGIAIVVTKRVYIKKEGDCGQIAPTICYIAAHGLYN